jgi:DNA-binding MurR/RpiR family transcriptional regulator
MTEITPSERKVADYILAHPEELVAMSVAELSEHSGGSQAAVIRLCKSAGFKGYQELKLKVAGDLQQQRDEGSGYQEINPSDSIERIMENVSNNNIQSIRDTMKILNPDHISKAVDALLRANRIYFYGMGASNLIAIDAQHKFLRINKTSFSFEDPHMQLVSSVMLSKDDVVVGISYSGESASTVECVRKAKEQGVTTITITRYGNTSLSQLADIPLYISSTENEIRSGATSSRITQLNVIDILYLGVASREYDQSVTYLEKSRSIVKRLK